MKPRHLIVVGVTGSDEARRAREHAVRRTTTFPVDVTPVPAPDRADAEPAPRR
jgi:hypothetical protein